MIRSVALNRRPRRGLAATQSEFNDSEQKGAARPQPKRNRRIEQKDAKVAKNRSHSTFALFAPFCSKISSTGKRIKCVQCEGALRRGEFLTMRLLDLTLASPAANLALDEALLERAEEALEPAEVLRLWEPAEPLVVVGRSSRVVEEVRLANCRQRGIPVLRRSSGGLAIVTGPGCLMYAVVLSYELRPELRMIDRAHEFVLATMVRACESLGLPVTRHGTSDLVLGLRKVSGNSLRCRRRSLLYHGTLLYDFPLSLISDCLAEPPRAPEYRAGRPHGEFVANLPVPAGELRRAIQAAWGAVEPLADWPQEMVERFVAEKYSAEEWNFRH